MVLYFSHIVQVLLQMADDFIESAVSASCGLAKHRKSGALEAKDLQMYLETSWNMTTPGFSGWWVWLVGVVTSG